MMKCSGRMMCGAAQCLAHQREMVILEITQPAVDELGAGRGGVRGQIILLAQEHTQSAPGGITCDPHAVDATAHDQEVVALERCPAHARRGACCR